MVETWLGGEEVETVSKDNSFEKHGYTRERQEFQCGLREILSCFAFKIGKT